MNQSPNAKLSPVKKPVFSILHPTVHCGKTKSSLDAAAREFKEIGYTVIQFLTPEECDENIISLVTNILGPGKQGYRPEYELVYPDPKTDRKAFLEWAKRNNRKDVQILGDGWCLHKTFGAPTEPAAFYSQKITNNKQHPALVYFAQQALGTEDIRVDMNRSILKLPGMGMPELLHWDKEFPRKVLGELGQVCGRIGFNAFSMILSKRTHTNAFRKEFVEKAELLYNAKEKSQSNSKFTIDPARDPMEIWAQKDGQPSNTCHEVEIPGGCAVFWNENSIHGSVKTKCTDPVQWGQYLCYYRQDRSQDWWKLKSADKKMNQEDALKLCHYTGRIPEFWPSGDPTHFCPAKYMNFPHLLKARLVKLKPDHPGITWRTSMINKKPKRVLHFVPLPIKNYTPPLLTSIGKSLLGITDKDKAPEPWIVEPQSKEDQEITQELLEVALREAKEMEDARRAAKEKKLDDNLLKTAGKQVTKKDKRSFRKGENLYPIREEDEENEPTRRKFQQEQEELKGEELKGEELLKKKSIFENAKQAMQEFESSDDWGTCDEELDEKDMEKEEQEREKKEEQEREKKKKQEKEKEKENEKAEKKRVSIPNCVEEKTDDKEKQKKKKNKKEKRKKKKGFIPKFAKRFANESSTDEEDVDDEKAKEEKKVFMKIKQPKLQ